MKKTMICMCSITFCLMLAAVSAFAQEEADSSEEAEVVTICHNGKTLVMSAQNAAKFLDAGATEGECADDNRDQQRDQDASTQQDQEKTSENAVKNEKQGQAKITICHKGTVTLTIAEAALPAHLKHGDTLGACASSNVQQGPQQAGQPNQKETSAQGQKNTGSAKEGNGKNTETDASKGKKGKRGKGQ